MLNGSLFGESHNCYGCGPKHSHGFRLNFHVENDEVVTEFTPTSVHEGVPTIMHGGLVTTVADELGGWALIALLGKFGFTGTMNSRFVRPVKIGELVRGRGRIVRNSSRLVRVAVSLTQGDTECFTSEMAFAVIDEAGVEKMIGGPLPIEWKQFVR